MRFLVILFFLFSLSVFAQKNTKIGELKGIDFKFGFMGFGLSNNDANKIALDIITPDLQKNQKQIPKLRDPQPVNFCHSFYLGLVSKNRWFNKSIILKNSENRFGIYYGNYAQRYGAITSGDHPLTDTHSSDYIQGIVKYDGYGVNFDYTINSKPFFKNFATYVSLGSAIILHNYSIINRVDFLKRNDPWLSTYPSGTQLINSKTSITSVDAKLVLGWKYNLSCEFNYFMELEFGGSYYNKGLYGNCKLLYMSNFTLLGIRYKFINPEEKTKNKANVFW